MKTCIVVPFYFAPRRVRSGYQTFQTPSDVIDLCAMCYEVYKDWDSGCETDIIFVNNSPEVDEAVKFLDSINNTDARRGKFIVLQGNNIGMGFGAHSLAFKTFRDNYDYWLFTEDDFIMKKPGLMKSAVDQLDSDPSIGFVACCGLSGDHAHGGIGCTSRKNLNKVWEKHGKLPHHESIANLKDNKIFKHTHIIHGEVAFTKCYIELGMRLEKVKSSSIPYARWDRKDSPHCDKRDMETWGVVAECLRDKN
jgi:hypothetical protein